MSEVIREIEAIRLPGLLGGGSIPVFELKCRCGAKYRSRNQNSLCERCQALVEDERRQASVRAASEQRVHATIASIPPRYAWAEFDSPLMAARIKSEHAIVRARRATGVPSIVLLGPAGCGKTSLACAILRAKAAESGKRGRFVSAFSLAKARQEHPLGQGEAPAVEKAASAQILLLDELAAEFGRNTAVQEVIHARHENELPTIYTSGFGQEDIASRYGDGITRRVFEGAVVIRFGGGAK